MTAPIPLDAIDKQGPLHPAATPEQDALLRWAEANQIERNSPPISRGRYKTTDPKTGKSTTWTRMSTLAKTLSDQTGIHRWEKANVARGIQADPDMVDRILDARDLAQWAGKVGGDYLKADLGTAMHTAVEVWERDPLAAAGLPAPWADDLTAITDALQRHGITPSSEWVEAVMIHPELKAAGRLDFCATGPWQGLRVCDLKTGSIDFGVTDWAAQLAGYATAPMRWIDGRIVTAEARDTETGIIIHAPLGTGTCHIYEIDLVRGKELLDACYAARVSRRGSKDLMVPHIPPESAEPGRSPSGDEPGPLPAATATDTGEATSDEPVHVSEPLGEVTGDLEARTDAWLAGRVKALADQPDAVRIIRTVWGDLPATPPWTAEQRARVEAAVTAGEAAVGAPFPAPRPADPEPREPLPEPAPVLRPQPDAGGEVSADVCRAVADGIRALDADRQTVFMRWRKEALRGARGWHDARDGQAWSARTHAAMVAIGECLTHLWDSDEPDTLTRAALAVTLGDDQVQPSFTTGALLGTLSPDESRQLTQIAAAFGRDEPDVVASLGLAVA